MRKPPLTVVVVDDDDIPLYGAKVVLERVPGVEVLECCGFDEAMIRDRWDDVDWVITDITFENAEEEQIPSVPLIERIRELTKGSRKPMIVAVSSNHYAFYEPFVRARLIEADPDIGLIWRKDLTEHINAAASADMLNKDLASLPAVDAPMAFDDLGVHEGTKINRLVDRTREFFRESAGKSETALLLHRDRIAGDVDLRPATKEGNTPRKAETPGIPQFRRIIQRTSVPRPPK